MKKIMLIGLLAAGFWTAACGASLDDARVVWTSPSPNAHGSMPLGNGDVGINAWVEPSGDLIFYVSKTDAWDENARLCKIGRVRVQLEPALAVTNGFRQELKVREGAIEIAAGGTQLRLWVDAQAPVVRVEAESAQPVSCRATVELWRLRERPFGDGDEPHSGNGLAGSPYKPTVLPDTVVPGEPGRVAWYHRNTRSLYNMVLQVQHLEALKDRFADPLLQHTFGASLSGEGFVRDSERTIKSAQAAKRHQLSVCVLAERAATPEAWLKDLAGVERRAPGFTKSRRQTAAWWQAFWERSWIFIDETKETAGLTLSYTLQRFMDACSGRGGSPIKFNGSIFTVEEHPGAPADQPSGCPDWRRWGGNYWFQNTRLAYWPMLAAGDFEMMQPWFKMYLDALPLGKARVQTYYRFDNAAVFPETMYFWGLPNNGDYGWNNKEPEPGNGYIRRYWSGNLEIVAVMLDRYDYTQDRAFARDVLVPLADPLIAFFDQYWTKRDAQGKMVMEPSQSLETWHTTINPMPEVAGFHFVLPRLLALPEDLTTAAQRARWSRLLKELPPVPVVAANGAKVLSPAGTILGGASNFENCELYGVFPFRLYGVGRDGLDIGRATFARRGHRHNRGWCQDSIQAACLGMGAEAGRLVVARAAQVNKDYRFPVMWGPNFDWIPDQDHGNGLMLTLQYMLLQPVGDKIYLFPAWPKTWNATFKLHAPKNTVVEGEVRDGKVTALKVTPKARAADVVNLLEK